MIYPQLKDRDMVLNQKMIDKQRVKQKYNSKIQHETDKMNRELELKLKAQREHLQVLFSTPHQLNLLMTYQLLFIICCDCII